MNTKFFANGKLKDKNIVEALKKAAKQYENGEIIEVEAVLIDIIDAIDEFERRN